MITLPLHAGTVPTVAAGVDELVPPFTDLSCNQTSTGGSTCSLQGNFNVNGTIQSGDADSSASAAIGLLFVYADAGGSPITMDFGSASASFSMDGSFSGTTTWEIGVEGGGDLDGVRVYVTAMGQDFYAHTGENFFTITSSGAPISASIYAYAETPGPESQEVSLDLVSAVTPEPGFGWIAGLGIAAMLALRHK